MAGGGNYRTPHYLKSLTPAELAQCNRASSFLQSGFWGSFKARFGWNARSFLAEWAGETAESGGITLPLLVIHRRLGPGVSFAYVPWGPELPGNFPARPEDRAGALGELARALRDLLPRDTAFIRFDPPWYTEGPFDTASAASMPPPLGRPFTRAAADVQPPDTVLIDLDLSPEAILGAMKPKWRYNIALAGKKGVSVRRADEAGLELFYAIYRETAQRDGIAIHGKEYYAALFSQSREYQSAGESGGTPDIRLYLAEHEGETLAGIVTLFRGPEGVYLYGASSNHKRNLMAPYALQWKAMEDAKAAGCQIYDLFGIPPHEDPSHPMAGLYRFKTGFGGRIIHRSGSWDYAYRPLMKGLYSTAEGLRKKLWNLKKRLKRR
jgi:lipid II:glycine glycyltransferase (peptidoglycan interpeptide bridge formation enzyme)